MHGTNDDVKERCRIQGVRGDIEPYFPLQPFILFAHYSYSTEHENEL